MAFGLTTSSTGIGLQPTLPTGDAGLNQPTLALNQSQSVSEQTAPGPMPYTPPVFTSDQLNQNLASSAATGYAGIGLNPTAGGTGINFAATTGTTASISGTFAAPVAATLPGGASGNDDSGTTTSSSVNQQLNIAGSATAKITPQPNVLDQYASYTYSLSLYLITKDQFNSLLNGPPNFSTWSLLMQSGGAEENILERQRLVEMLVNHFKNEPVISRADFKRPVYYLVFESRMNREDFEIGKDH